MAGPASAAEQPSNAQLRAAIDCRDVMFDSDPREYNLWAVGHGGRTWGQIWIDPMGGGFYDVCVHNGVKDHAGDGRAAIAFARFEWWDGSRWIYEPWYVFSRNDGVLADPTYLNGWFVPPLRNFKMGVCLGPATAPGKCTWEDV